MPPSHWLVKSEPYKYSFAQLEHDGRTRWDGVRNFEARNTLRAMSAGDLVLFYHSNEGKAVVGVARVVATAYPDPTAPGEDWSVVDIAPVKALACAVDLATIRGTPSLAMMALLRRMRLSVTPVTPAEFTTILRLGKTVLGPRSRPPKAAAARAKTVGAVPSLGATAAGGPKRRARASAGVPVAARKGR